MSSIEIDQTRDVSARADLPTEAGASATADLPTDAGLALPAGLGLASPAGATPQDMIMRQTDYTIEIVQQKLLEHNNDVMQVIREYMKPQAKPSAFSPPKTLSTNQQIYKEIRGMMDDAAATYNNSKKL